LAVEKQPPRRMVLKLVAIGLFAGFLVGMSSVGSGSVVMVLLLLLVNCPPAVLVGTDIVHAIALTGFTGILQFRLGNVDLGLVLSLLVGSIPGALIGVKISQHLPSLWLKRTLCVILLITGARMLGI
ncbi:MAG: sulfite exporter TauE/SafE family protein, partial [Terriglobia bacterium]